jgi:hypothetical protein
MARRLLRLAAALSLVAPWILATSTRPVVAGPIIPDAPVIIIETANPPSSSAGVVDTTWQNIQKGDGPYDMHIDVAWAPTNPPPGAPSPGPASNAQITCNPLPNNDWDCQEPWPLLNGNYVLNGTYKVTAWGRANRQFFGPGPESPHVSASINVANPPAPTKNVAAAVQPDSSVKITWDPSPEPDVFAYAVFRFKNGQPAGEVDHCEVGAGAAHPCPSPISRVDSTSGGGVFTYQVVAYRYGATYNTNDILNAASVSTKSVTVPGPPAPTTTIAPNSPSATSATVALGAAAGAPAATFPAVSPSPGSRLAIGGASNSTLPADPTVQPAAPSDPAAVGRTASNPGEDGSRHSVGGWGAVAAGLLLVVLAMVGLWVRSQVKQAGILEPLEPGSA